MLQDNQNLFVKHMRKQRQYESLGNGDKSTIWSKNPMMGKDIEWNELDVRINKNGEDKIINFLLKIFRKKTCKI